MSVEQGTKDIDNLIEIAKWEMYGEEWSQAEQNLKNAKNRAINIKDKGRIDIILGLLNKVSKNEKVPL